MTETSLHSGCHCRTVRITLAHQPDYLNDCDCSLCASHGVLWGYFDPAHVAIAGETKVYVRADIAEPAVALHFCGACGSTTHWTALPAFVARHPGLPPRMGVNMRLFGPEAVAGLELRFPDGRGWKRAGAFAYRKPSIWLGADGA